jgi:cobalt-zinc-cadmium efflux system membrane fusion protein
MSDAVKDPGETVNGQDVIDRRALPRRRQIQISLVGLVVVAIGVIVVYAGGRAFGKPDAPVAEAAPPPGTFRATPQQMKTLTVAQVGTHGFVSEERTEGKIAVNGDRSTPLFSP